MTSFTRPSNWLARRRWLAGVLAFGAALSAASCGDMQDENPSSAFEEHGGAVSVKAMTYNILSAADVGALRSGYPAWSARRRHCVDLIHAAEPDLVSIEEATDKQIDQLVDDLGDYDLVARRAVTTDAVLFYRRAAFEKVETGHWKFGRLPTLGDIIHHGFGLMPQLARIAVWAKLPHVEAQREIFVVATHFDARDALKARSIRKLHNRLHDFTLRGIPMVIMGDFNIAADEPIFQQLADGAWHDSFPEGSSREQNTFPARAPSRRIDHVIYAGEGVSARNWRLVRPSRNVLASDHFAVEATIDVTAR
jgi:endonuclease/exonuclease/phosphatase family metal-dependent hydrolase